MATNLNPTSRQKADPTLFNWKRAYDEFYSLIIAQDRLWEMRQTGHDSWQMPLVAAATVTALACEIGMKYLRWVEQQKFEAVHDLALLFKNQTSATKKEILDSLNIDSAQCDIALKGAQHAFVEWRYVFEKDEAKLAEMTATVDFVRALCGAVAATMAGDRIRPLHVA